VRSRAASLDRLAGSCATAVGVGGLLYGVLFAWIVWGSPAWVPELWFGLLLLGGLLSVPVAVALFQRLRVVDEGLALTALVLAVLASAGGILHGGFGLAKAVNPGAVAEGQSPDALGALRFATGGVSLLVLGWLVAAGAALPQRLAPLALLSGAVLVFTYLGRVFDFITPDTKATLIPPLLYGLILHPALYLWLGRALRPSPPPAGPDDAAAARRVA
jgi:hypothetical protein